MLAFGSACRPNLKPRFPRHCSPLINRLTLFHLAPYPQQPGGALAPSRQPPHCASSSSAAAPQLSPGTRRSAPAPPLRSSSLLDSSPQGSDSFRALAEGASSSAYAATAHNRAGSASRRAPIGAASSSSSTAQRLAPGTAASSSTRAASGAPASTSGLPAPRPHRQQRPGAGGDPQQQQPQARPRWGSGGAFTGALPYPPPRALGIMRLQMYEAEMMQLRAERQREEAEDAARGGRVRWPGEPSSSAPHHNATIGAHRSAAAAATDPFAAPSSSDRRPLPSAPRTHAELLEAALAEEEQRGSLRPRSELTASERSRLDGTDWETAAQRIALERVVGERRAAEIERGENIPGTGASGAGRGGGHRARIVSGLPPPPQQQLQQQGRGAAAAATGPSRAPLRSSSAQRATRSAGGAVGAAFGGGGAAAAFGGGGGAGGGAQQHHLFSPLHIAEQMALQEDIRLRLAARAQARTRERQSFLLTQLVSILSFSLPSSAGITLAGVECVYVVRMRAGVSVSVSAQVAQMARELFAAERETAKDQLKAAEDWVARIYPPAPTHMHPPTGLLPECTPARNQQHKRYAPCECWLIRL